MPISPFIIMKKTYVKPKMKIYFIDRSIFLCTSVPLSDFGDVGAPGVSDFGNNNIIDAGDF